MKIVQIINTGDTAQNVIESGGGGGGAICILLYFCYNLKCTCMYDFSRPTSYMFI